MPKICMLHKIMLEQLMNNQSVYIIIDSLDEALQLVELVNMPVKIKDYLDKQGVLYDEHSSQNTMMLITDYIYSMNLMDMNAFLDDSLIRVFYEFTLAFHKETIADFARMTVADVWRRRWMESQKGCENLWMKKDGWSIDLLTNGTEDKPAMAYIGEFGIRRSATDWRYLVAQMGGMQIDKKTYRKLDYAFGLDRLFESLYLEQQDVFQSLFVEHSKKMGGDVR